MKKKKNFYIFKKKKKQILFRTPNKILNSTTNVSVVIHK